MYSKNDYRYYLENRLTYYDNYLAHYGVKGMKWKQHKNHLSDNVVNGAKNIPTPDHMSINVVAGAEIVKKTAKKSIAKKNTKKASNKYKKLRISNIINDSTRSLFKRSRPNGKKLKGSSNIYVSHD